MSRRNQSAESRWRIAGLRALLPAILLLVAPGALAGELYRWVDSEGRPYFGDRPPPEGAQQVERLSMPAFAMPERSADEDPYSILNQLGRLQESREAQERERRERAWMEREYALRRRELDVREQEATSADSGGAWGYVSPVYPRPPGYRPGRPGHRPGRPVHRPRYSLPGFGGPDHPAFRPRPPYVAPQRPIVRPRPLQPEPRQSARGASANLRR